MRVRFIKHGDVWRGIVRPGWPHERLARPERLSRNGKLKSKGIARGYDIGITFNTVLNSIIILFKFKETFS